VRFIEKECRADEEKARESDLMNVTLISRIAPALAPSWSIHLVTGVEE
jgi:hypothetical protein